jgi:hypothetical protein
MKLFRKKSLITQVPVTKAYGVIIPEELKQTAQCSSIVIRQFAFVGYFRPPVPANKC